MKPKSLIVLIVLLLVVSAIPTVLAQNISNPKSYFGFTAVLLEINEKSLNASLSLFVTAQLENATAPETLQLTVLGGTPISQLFLLPVSQRNKQFAFYQSVILLEVPLQEIHTTSFPFDSYDLNISARVVPTYLFDSNSSVTVGFIVVQSLANALWNIQKVGEPSFQVDKDHALALSGISASISRASYVQEEAIIPILGLIWLVGGSMSLEASRDKERKQNVSNRLTVTVAAYVGFTGLALASTHLPTNFTFPSAVSLLLIVGELSTTILAFSTFIDSTLDSRRRTFLVDLAGVIFAIATMIFLIKISIGGFITLEFSGLPLVIQFTVVVGLLSGLIVRIFRSRNTSSANDLRSSRDEDRAPELGLINIKEKTNPDSKVTSTLEQEFVLARINTRESSTLTISTVAASASLVFFGFVLDGRLSSSQSLQWIGIAFAVFGLGYREITAHITERIDYSLLQSFPRLTARREVLVSSFTRGFLLRSLLFLPIVVWIAHSINLGSAWVNIGIPIAAALIAICALCFEDEKYQTDNKYHEWFLRCVSQEK